MRPARGMVAALVLSAVAACGTTVPVTSRAAGPQSADGLGGGSTAGTTGGSSSGTTGSTVPTGATGSTGSTGGLVAPGATGGAGTGTGSTGTGLAPGTAGGTGGQQAAGAVPEKGRGWDRTTIKIGVMTQQDVQSVAEGFGLNSVDSGDQVADVKAVIADLNSKGGLFGRRLVPEIYDVATAGDQESQGQAACSHFTRDVPVIAVYAMALVGDVPSFRACMKKGKVPVLAAGGQAFDDQVFNELQGYYSLMTFPSWTRFAGHFLDRLKAQQYYTGWNTTTGAPGPAPVKTAFLCGDTPIARRVGAVVRKESTRVGFPLASEVYLAAGGTDASGAVLRLKSDGITHVLYCDLTLFAVAQQAESQHYRPRYGVSTFNTPVLFLQGLVSDSQLAGSVGVGFAPTLDVDAQHDLASGGPAGEAACRALAKRHGVTYSGSRRLAQGILYDTCDILALVVSAAKATNALDGTAVMRGIGLVGSQLRSAYTFTSGLSPSVRANPSSTRDLFFDGSCRCYRYRGGLTRLPA